MRRLATGGAFLAIVTLVLVVIDMDSEVEDIKLKTQTPEQQKQVMKRLKSEMSDGRFNDFLESLTITLTAKELKHAQKTGRSPDPKMEYAREEVDGMSVGEVIEFAEPYVEGARAKRFQQSQKSMAITAKIEQVRLVEDEHGYNVPQVDLRFNLSGQYSPQRVELNFKIGDRRFTDFVDTRAVVETTSETVTHTIDLLEPAIGEIIESPDELAVTETTRFWEDGELHEIP